LRPLLNLTAAIQRALEALDGADDAADATHARVAEVLSSRRSKPST
jgi:hypothetical protein